VICFFATSGLSRQGKPDVYFVLRDRSPDAAVVSLDQFFDNGQADACPSKVPGPRFFAPVKPFENKGKIFLGQLTARIDKKGLEPFRDTFGGDPDKPPGGVYCQAFCKRLVTTWESLSGSARTGLTSSMKCISTRIFLPSN
jgi:hypothetical protein